MSASLTSYGLTYTKNEKANRFHETQVFSKNASIPSDSIQQVSENETENDVEHAYVCLPFHLSNCHSYLSLFKKNGRSDDFSKRSTRIFLEVSNFRI